MQGVGDSAKRDFRCQRIQVHTTKKTSLSRGISMRKQVITPNASPDSDAREKGLDVNARA